MIILSGYAKILNRSMMFISRKMRKIRLFTCILIFVFAIVSSKVVLTASPQMRIGMPLSSAPPMITPSFNLTIPILSTLDYNITWIIEDSDIGSANYSVYRDGVLIIDNIAWTSIAEINVSVNDVRNYSGIYNYTIFADDGLGERSTSTITVEVINELPVVEESDTIPTYLFLYMDEPQITWLIVSDPSTNGTFYEVFINDVQVDNGTWAVNDIITVNVSTSSVGEFIYKLILYDGLNGTTTDIVLVSVYNNVNPYISHPYDILTTVNETVSIVWMVSDTSILTTSYHIYRNGTEIQNGSWSISTPISVAVDTTMEGYFNYTVIIYDGMNGSATDTVFVLIEAPYIEPPSEFGDPNYVGIVIVLIISGFGFVSHISYSRKIKKISKMEKKEEQAYLIGKKCPEGLEMKNGVCVPKL